MSDSCIIGVYVAVVILCGRGCVVLCDLDQIKDFVNLASDKPPNPTHLSEGPRGWRDKA